MHVVTETVSWSDVGDEQLVGEDELNRGLLAGEAVGEDTGLELFEI